jgi:hypothetical protein
MRITRAAAAAASAGLGDSSWTANLVTKQEEVRALASGFRTVAVLGIKTVEKAEQPAYHVPEYLQSQGMTVVPVPVYYPDVKEILGEKVYRRVADIPQPVDCVCVFRKPEDVTQHIDDILAVRYFSAAHSRALLTVATGAPQAKPKCVWLQLGIRNDAAAEVWAKAGLKVVQDRCLLVEHQRARL